MRYILSHLLIIFVVSGCAYKMGTQGRRIPGGYTLVAVPVFKNKTKTVSIESFFTRSMIEEIEQSRLGRITDKEESQVIVEGVIDAVEVIMGSEASRDTTNFERLPEGTTLTREYRVVVRSTVRLRRTTDMAILWESKFSGERRYPAAIVTQQVINTVNPIYNHNAQIQSIRILAKDIMSEAYNQMTESF